MCESTCLSRYLAVSSVNCQFSVESVCADKFIVINVEGRQFLKKIACSRSSLTRTAWDLQVLSESTCPRRCLAVNAGDGRFSVESVCADKFIVINVEDRQFVKKIACSRSYLERTAGDLQVMSESASHSRCLDVNAGDRQFSQGNGLCHVWNWNKRPSGGSLSCRSKLRTVLKSCQTLKIFKKNFQKFEKFFESDQKNEQARCLQLKKLIPMKLEHENTSLYLKIDKIGFQWLRITVSLAKTVRVWQLLKTVLSYLRHDEEHLVGGLFQFQTRPRPFPCQLNLSVRIHYEKRRRSIVLDGNYLFEKISCVEVP